MGAETRKEKVTPSGTPAVTNPMKSGTAEQEQNGVTVPSSAARTFPTVSRFPVRILRARSAVKNDRRIPIPNTASVSRRSTFGAS